MSKWSGQIGFIVSEEIRPSVYKDRSVERHYRGDVISEHRSWQSSENVSDNVNINNKISVISDLYATSNIGFMKWVEFMGAKWKIKSIEVKHPRLILTIGDLYNG